MRVTISIVSHGQGSLARQLLDQIAALGDARVARVVVTRNIAEHWEPGTVPGNIELTVIDNAAPRGFAANHNAAFAVCDTELFWVLNPDIRLIGNPLDALVAAFANDPALALASPVVREPGGHRADFFRALPTPLDLFRRWGLGRREPAPAQPCWIAGMAVMVRANAFARLGGFDEGYFMYCEDFDLCARFGLAGQRIAVTDGAEVMHDARRDSHRSPRRLANHVFSLLRMWATPVFWRYGRQLATQRP
ncbi:glycosyltransferase [Derxia gummosa]|uniref:Glycosyltransferase n=1 Tax=Derxia gummosa DSM 723 TaxID=1121388 RepID=A0A8B6X2E1_9BURK|nr:glycosyltransferase [Derxia gummosa]